MLEMMVASLVVIAGVVCGPWMPVVRSQMVRTSLEDECYNVGTCTPLEEPKGDQKEICRIFEESLACMNSAMEACRQLNFPPDTVHMALDGVRILRETLQTYCSDQPLVNSTPFGQTTTASADVIGDVTELGEEEEWKRKPDRVDEEHTGRSEQVQAQINSGNRLPFPAISTTLVASLLLAPMLNVWITTAIL